MCAELHIILDETVYLRFSLTSALSSWLNAQLGGSNVNNANYIYENIRLTKLKSSSSSFAPFINPLKFSRRRMRCRQFFIILWSFIMNIPIICVYYSSTKTLDGTRKIMCILINITHPYSIFIWKMPLVSITVKRNWMACIYLYL